MVAVWRATSADQFVIALISSTARAISTLAWPRSSSTLVIDRTMLLMLWLKSTTA